MASPSASSGTRLASGSGGDAVAGIASKSKAPTAIDDRPPTPPMSDTEPFPALDAEITTADDTSAAPRVPRIDTDHSRGNTSTSAGVHDAPDTASAECGSAAGQQSDLDHLNVDIEPARSQPSPVTPPYWSHSPAPSEQRPVLSSHQPSALGSPSYASSDTTVSPTTPRSSFDRYSHTRSMTSESIDSLMEGGSSGGGITLRDNENSNLDDRGSACWARSVVIRDYVIVNGGATSIGAFVVWNVRVETLSGSHMNICKRYSEFDDLRSRLVRSFPSFEGAVPELPRKSIISKFRPSFLEKRRAGLQYFLNCIMLNPEFSGSPILKEFLFS